MFKSCDTKEVLLPKQQRGSFMPYICLMGDYRGMAWFAESDRGWTQSMDVPAVSVERNRDEITLVLNIISEPVEITEARSLEFGLEVLPLRAPDKYWRTRIDFDGVPDFGGNLRGGPSRSFDYLPENEDWEAVRRRLEDGKAGFGDAYYCLKEQADKLKYFRRDWGREPEPQEYPVLTLYTCITSTGNVPEHSKEWLETWGSATDTIYYTREFIDYSAWTWDQWLANTPVGGHYMDGPVFGPQFKDTGLVAYTLPDGQVQPGYQWRGIRERFKRMRQICHDRKVVPHLCVHMTNQMFAPQMAFVDTMLDGEYYYAVPPRTTTFIDHWPPERIRVNNIMKWGPAPTWLGWCTNQMPVSEAKYGAWIYRQSRAYAADLLANDIMCFRENMIDLEFRLPGTETVPYWDKSGLAVHDHKGLAVTAWKRPGKCLVFLANFSRQRIEATVKLDVGLMGFASEDPDGVSIKDKDPNLLKYFKEDPTTVKAPDMDAAAKERDEPGNVDGVAAALDERAEDIPDELRRSKDPDGKFKWKAGVLSCPVRPHDYRMFLFAAGKDAQ